MVASPSHHVVSDGPLVRAGAAGPEGLGTWAAVAPLRSADPAAPVELAWLDDSQQRERIRLAHELHDVVGQVLTAIRISLMVARRTNDPIELDAQLHRSLKLIDTAQDDVRAIAYDLRPSGLGDLGLAAAVRWYLARQEDVSGVRMVLRSPPVLHVGGNVEAAAYRIVQEATTNVLRHAAAGEVVVTLRIRRGGLDLDIEDDGVGFDLDEALATRGSLGLTGMFERAHLASGRLLIRSERGRGTRLHARFPLGSGR